MSPATRRSWAALATVAAAASLQACKEVEKAEKQHYQPATLSPLKGDPDHHVVTLTPEGADRISLATERVRRAGRRLVIPYSSLMYEPDGHTYVYISPKRLTFHRMDVKVERIAGDRVILRAGPPAGTPVVTTGAAQVHGAELEYGEY